MTTPLVPVIGTLGFVLSPGGGEVLLVHRNARPDDESLGKWNGLGGKVHRDEDVAAAMRRELHEEAALTVTEMSLRGTVTWPGFGRDGTDWLGFVFLVTGWAGTVPERNEEGDLHWVPLARLLDGSLPMWPGDRHFLPLVFDGDPRPFHGCMPYAGGVPTGWSYTR